MPAKAGDRTGRRGRRRDRRKGACAGAQDGARLRTRARGRRHPGPGSGDSWPTTLRPRTRTGGIDVGHLQKPFRCLWSPSCPEGSTHARTARRRDCHLCRASTGAVVAAFAYRPGPLTPLGATAADPTQRNWPHTIGACAQPDIRRSGKCQRPADRAAASHAMLSTDATRVCPRSSATAAPLTPNEMAAEIRCGISRSPRGDDAATNRPGRRAGDDKRSAGQPNPATAHPGARSISAHPR